MQTTTSNRHLEFPTEFEARCFLYATRDGLTQSRIAVMLSRDQTVVGRAIRSTRAKLLAIQKSGRFDSDELDEVMFKLTGQTITDFRDSEST